MTRKAGRSGHGGQEVRKAMSLEAGSVNSRFASGLDRDLENARVLIEDEPWCESPQKYRKAAEVILRRVLTVDPKNEAARALMLKIGAEALEVTWPPGPVAVEEERAEQSRWTSAQEPELVIKAFAAEQPAAVAEPPEAVEASAAAGSSSSESEAEAPAADD